MNRILLLLLSFFVCSAVWSEEVDDSMIRPGAEDCAVENSFEHAEFEPKLDTALVVGTYKNWLGEKCLEFGPNEKSYYNWKRDVTYVGIPLFLSSFIIKGQKTSFRSARFAMDSKWKSELDNYTQFSPYAAVVGLKAFGYEGRSSWDRMLVSTLMSNAVMATIVNSTKYSVKEMRPDNSTRNSFPSGHTATAFAAATVLHKEYGLTRSPWFSVGGYIVAMGTGFSRVLNNRHWISDVMAGAGIGILSTELGYFLADLIYQNKGIVRKELAGLTNTDRPSFFDIQMGVGLHSSTLTAKYDNGTTQSFELGTSTTVGVEGAHFINKHLGFGGMARVTTTPTKGLALSDADRDGLVEMNQLLEWYLLPSIYNVNASNNNFIDGSFDLGVYGNLPLGRHFSLGAKALAGVRASSGFDFKARAGYRLRAMNADGDYLYTAHYDNKMEDFALSPLWVFENPDGSLFNSNETLMPGVTTTFNYHLDPSQYVSDEYAIMKVTGGCAFNYILGLSATYRYKDNFSWKIFCDFDSSRNKYRYRMDLFDDATYNYMHSIASEYPVGSSRGDAVEKLNMIRDRSHIDESFRSRLNFITIGGAFTVNF